MELSKFKKRIKLEQAGKEVVSRPDAQASGEFFENGIGVITVEELAVIFGLAPQTIRNWITLGKIPHVKAGRRYFLQEEEYAGVAQPKGGVTMAMIKRQYRTKKQKPVIFYQAEVFVKVFVLL